MQRRGDHSFDPVRPAAPSRVTRRAVLRPAAGLTLLGGAALAGGCRAGGQGEGAGGRGTQEPVQLRLMTWVTDREWVPRFWQGYTRHNPRATVEVDILDGGGNAGDDKFLIAAAGGAPPDLFWTGRSSVAEWGIDGVVAQLDDRLKGSKAIRVDNFIPKAIEEGGWRGKTYGLYFSADTRILYWNKEHLATAGLDPEKPLETWDAVATAIPRLVKRPAPDRIERLAIHPTYNSVGAHYWEAWYWALGGQYLNPETLQVTFVNEQAVQALEWMKRQVDLQGGWAPLDAFWQEATAATPNRQAGWGFGGERVSLFIETGDVVTSLAQYYPQIRYGLGEIPAAPSGKRGSVRGGFFWVLPKGTKRPDAAWDFLEWAFGRAPMLEYNDHFNRIPTTQEVLNSPEYTRGGEVRRVLQKVVAYSQRIPAIVPGYAEILTINGRFPTEVLSGQKSPREALEGAAHEIQAVLDKWKGRA